MMLDFSDVLLTVDFDRTLTDPNSQIPQRNLEAIHWFMERGGAFTVNTGRSIPMCLGKLLPEVPVNVPLLLYNGSAAYDKVTGQLINVHPIDLDPDAVIEELQAMFPELNIEIQGVDAHYLARKNEMWERYCDHNGGPWGYSIPHEIPGPFMKFSIYGTFEDETVAAMYRITDREQALFRQAIRYVEEKYGDKVDIFRACPRIVDIHAKGCSKIRSARELQQKLGRKILVCVGDAENDLPMLEGADYAFCPEDGIVADRFPNVCKCADGAVADVIYKKIPEILGF